MITLDQLNDAIDPATGTLRLSVPLISLPDTVGPPFAVAAAYASPGNPEIYEWNLSAPTGVLGLGWSLGSMRIVALHAPDTDAEPSYYLLSGAAAIALIRLGTDPEGAQTYGRFDGAFWIIRYYRASQRWLLIDENAIRFGFGNWGTANVVETRVVWTQWFDSSVVVASQSSSATVWHLSQITDLWGNVTEFDYLQVASTVGQGVDAYTQACYLKTVTGAGGGQLVFDYEDKTANEVQPANTAPPPPNAWQNVYEAKYLKSIAAIAPGGAVLQSVAFSYDFLGSGNFTKRLLTSIQILPPTGRAGPSLDFAYGATGAGSDPSYGRIAKITTPDGGVGMVSYASVLPALSNRGTVLQAPTGGPYADPALTLGGDFALTVWKATDNSQFAIVATSWDGRWISTPLATLVATATSVLQSAVASESFAVRADASFVAYRRDPAMAGAWTGPSSAFPAALTLGEAAATVCTNGAAAVLGLTSLQLTAATWTGSGWGARATATLAGGGQAPVAALGASDVCMVAAAVDGADANAQATITLMGTDAMRHWWSTSLGLPRPSAAIDGISVQVGTTFAVIRSSGLSGASRVATFDVVDWAQGQPRTQRLTQFNIATSDALPGAAIHGASIAIGQLLFRYDGRAWGTQDAGSIVPSGAAIIATLSPGTDLLLRGFTATGGGSVLDVVAYDPNLAAWSSVLSGVLPAGAYVAHAPVTRNQASNFVVFARPAGQGGNPSPTNAVYYRMPNAQWSHAFDIPEILTTAESASLQVVGEGYLVYQSGTGVIAYPLASGAVNTAGRTALTSQTLLVPNAGPDALLSRRFFATYSGTWGQNPTISLHCMTPSGADGVQPLTVVSRLRILCGNTVDPATGYPAVDATPAYESGSAAANNAGTFARFNRTAMATTSVATGAGNGSVLAELFNGLTAAETAALSPSLGPNYPTGASTNAAQYTRILMGTPYRSTQSWIDLGGTARSNVQTTSLYVTMRHFLQPGDASGDPVGFCARAAQSLVSTDGVTTTMTVAFNANLLPQTVTATRFDANGNLETLTGTSTYFPEHYGTDGPENLLTPVIQTQNATNGSVVEAQVTTWSSAWNMAAAHWAPRAAFAANAANFAAFGAWNGGAPPAGWLNSDTIVVRNNVGAAVAALDALGRSTFNLYDRNNARIVARFENATPQQVSYYGFETYERNAAWSYAGSSSLQSHIVSTQYHTGSRSLEIVPNGAAQTGPTASFLQTTGGESYLFSCWMLLPPGFVADAAKARWTLQVYSAGSAPAPVGDPVVLAFPAASTRWQYLQAAVDLARIKLDAGIAAGASVSITVSGYDNRGAGVSVYVDELCFAPLGAVFSASVFDASSGRISATLTANGATRRPVYDGGGRTCAMIGPGEQNVAWISLLAHARAMSPDGSYQPNFPNQVVAVESASFGNYQDFDASDASLWTLSASWSIADNQLVFDGTSADPIGSRAELKDFSQANYAALVRVPADPGAAATVSIGTADVFVSWVPGTTDGTWMLRQQVSGSWNTVASLLGSYAEQWLFAVVDNVVFFFAGGAQIFGWRIAAATQGKLQLAAKTSAAFEELVIAVDPGLAVTFIDGAGSKLATMAMVDSQTMQITGVLFDPLGRPAYQRNPVRQSVVLDTPALSGGTASDDTGLNEGGLTTYLPFLPGGSQMTLAQYIDPATSGAPYAQTVFEASPLCRPIEIGAPGADFTIGSGHTTLIAYGANVANSWLGRVLQPNSAGLGAGSYYSTSVTSPDGVVVETISNQSGQVVARALTPSGANAPTSIESFQYDGAGRQILHRQPNYYFPPADSTAATWTETASYDFTGNLTQSTSPDSGTTKFLSDATGRPRFTMDAAGAALTPPVIRYVRYDALDRIVERGTVSKSGLTWDDLAGHVDDETWPTASDGATWARRYVFDRPDTVGAHDPQPPNLAGRLAQLKVNTTGGPSPSAAATDLYSYFYDLAGNVAQQNSYVHSFDTTTRQAQFGWDNIGRPIEVTYPRPLDPVTGAPQGTATNVTYFYDRVGRIAGIGTAGEGTEVLDPSDPNPGPKASYADYTYGAGGLLASVAYGSNSGGPVAQNFQYDPAGRSLAIAGDYFSQTLTYGTGGLASSTDWSGRATSATTRYAAKPGPVDDPASGMLGTRTWSYRYDALGRLNGAVASDVSQNASLAFGTASAPATYDANGALLTVPGPAASETYFYAMGSPAQRANNRVQQIGVGIAVTLDFSKALPGGWTFGASNHGPTTSSLVTTGTDAPFFQLGGGSLGHYEVFQFTGSLGQSETYTLTIGWRAPAPFATQAGLAVCDLVLTQAQGSAYRARLMDFSAGAADWQTATITIDMAAATAASGFAGAIASVGIQFGNAKRDISGQSGAPLQINALSLVRATGSPVPASYVYDASGRMTKSPPRMIDTIYYDAMSGRLERLAFASGQPVSSVFFARGPDEAVASKTIYYPDDTSFKILELRAPGGGLLGVETIDPDGVTTKTLFLRDLESTFGNLPVAAGGPNLYQLRDRLGSLRAVAAAGDGSDAGLRQRIDYGPFGQQIFSAGSSPSAERFTGQDWDASSGLGDYNARFYDPQLRGFLQPDNARQNADFYTYVGGDPVNRTDPSGNLVGGLLLAGFGAYWAYRAYGLHQSGFLGYVWKYPQSALLDMGEIAVSWAGSAVTLMGLSWALGPALGAYRGAVHTVVPQWVPVVSMTTGWLSAMYSSAAYGVVRTASERFVRKTRDSLSAGDLADAAITYGYEARYASALSVFYSHFLAQPIRFPYRGRNGWHFIDGRRGGPGIVQTPAGPLFRLADGTFAFEEYAVGGGYILPFLQRGNSDMTTDTNRALMLSEPYAYFFRGWRYGGQQYRASGLVLEHRTQGGSFLFVPHTVHTPRRGGPNHIGISTFIKKGIQYQWIAANAFPRVVDMLRVRSWMNATLIAEEGAGGLGDDDL